MKRRTLVSRSLRFHTRAHLAAGLGVAAGCAALAGALLVGDSMRGSLREAALGRLGRVDQALFSTRFFSEQLAGKLAAAPAFRESFTEIAPIISLSGGVRHGTTGRRVNKVQVLGVDARFWALRTSGTDWPVPQLSGREVAINAAVAGELGASVGDALLLRVGKPSTVSAETLLGRRDDRSSTLRLTVSAILPDADIAAFGANPRQSVPANLFVPLPIMQRALDMEQQVSALLVASRSDNPGESQAGRLNALLAEHLALDDLGLRLRLDAQHGYAAFESGAMLIAPQLEQGILDAAKDHPVRVDPLITYLANEIRAVNPSAGKRVVVPYSTVTALDPAGETARRIMDTRGFAGDTLREDGAWINQWTGEQLGAETKDRITLRYFVNAEKGELKTVAQTFDVRGQVPLDGIGGDPGFTPDYRGVTDTENLADWDAPFPLDLGRVKDADEEYWDRHRAAPKVFVSLDQGEQLWSQEADRFGRYTAIRLYADQADQPIAGLADRIAAQVVNAADTKSLGLAFDPIRLRLAQAGRGTTDFGMLFIGFSFFLIASSSMLVALLFRLAIERRAREPGLMRALGWPDGLVLRTFIAEGLGVAVAGSLLGLVGALAYAKLMLYGLTNWWADAAQTPFLRLHVAPTSLAAGFAASVLISGASMAIALRGLRRVSIRALLAGAAQAGTDRHTARSRFAPALALVAGLAAVLLGIAPFALGQEASAPLFFGCGALLLVCFIAALTAWLRRSMATASPQQRRLLLSWKNASRNVRRSVLTAGLIASATFLIAALQAFQLRVDEDVLNKNSGTGGFAIFGESSVSVVYDLNTDDGREKLNINPDTSKALGEAGLRTYAARLRAGDEASCLNLYQPTEPRIIGVPDDFIDRGGFVFKDALATTEEHENNPWLLLHEPTGDGTIPVIGDEAAVLWQFHSGLGKEITVTDERGRDVRLRFVALLGGSFLQDELIVSEQAFIEMFPSIDGYGFFLLETQGEAADQVAGWLEAELETFGFDAGHSADRLAGYLAVQNTYLSTFQMLGGFGLILGTLGLSAVMLRNIHERKGELALMQAVGFSRSRLYWFVLFENAALLGLGVAGGFLCAMVAISPHIVSRNENVAWASLALILGLVFVVGMTGAMLSAGATMRLNLVRALRSE